MAPSSLTERAPRNAYRPPATHTARNRSVLGKRAATSPGVRRIPEPTVLPTVTASPNPMPSTRSSAPWGREPAIASPRYHAPMSRQFDVVLCGAGHNGLVAATLLAREGLQVLVL